MKILITESKFLEQDELSCYLNLQIHTHDDSSAFAPVHIEYNLYYSIIYDSCIR